MMALMADQALQPDGRRQEAIRGLRESSQRAEDNLTRPTAFTDGVGAAVASGRRVWCVYASAGESAGIGRSGMPMRLRVQSTTRRRPR